MNWRSGFDQSELTERCARKLWYGMRWAVEGVRGRAVEFFLNGNPSDEEIARRLNLGGHELETKVLQTTKTRYAEICMSEVPPKKISDKADERTCKGCFALNLCQHQDFYAVVPQKNCRTCAHVTPNEDLSFSCEARNKKLDQEEQEKGCEKHLYNPSFFEWEPIDADNTGITYLRKNGKRIKNKDGGTFENC